jgi:hypothetical protein
MPTSEENFWAAILTPIILMGGFGRITFLKERYFIYLAYTVELFFHSLPLGAMVFAN